MSYWNKVQAGLSKAQVQAVSAANEYGGRAVVGGQQFSASFTLEKESVGDPKHVIAWFPLCADGGFLADPHHPQSALNAIPREVLRRAKGLAIFTVVKAGFVWSAKMGSGIVIARLHDGSWSAPSCIGTGGVGVGLQIGADLSEFVIVLNNDETVKAFSKGGNVTIGGNLQASAGPIGTGGSVNIALQKPAPMFSYSKSKGLFAGVSLEGTVLVERAETNTAFYGTKIPAQDLLAGKVPPPEVASQLYDIIEAAESMDEHSLPHESYVPPPPAGQALFDAHRGD